MEKEMAGGKNEENWSMLKAKHEKNYNNFENNDV